MLTRSAAFAACCVAIIAIAGCGTSRAKPHQSAAPSTNTAAAGPPTCNGYTKGRGGVINVFCGGSAKASGTIAGTPFDLHGGSCVRSVTFMSVNVGVLVGRDFTGEPPDYLGIVLKPASGPFSNVAATIDSGGSPHAVMLSGTLDDDLRGGRFSGSDGSIPVSGSFHC